MYRYGFKFRMEDRFIWVAAVLAVAVMLLPGEAQAQRRRGAAATVATKTIKLQTIPNAAVWVDDVRRGTADASGRLDLPQVSLRPTSYASGRRGLRN